MSSISSAASLAGRLTVGGLATGLDTDRLIQGLLSIQQRQVDLLQRKQNKFVQEQTAFKGVEARLLSLQGQLTQLGRSQNNVFDSRQVTSSHKDLLTAAASGSATPGVYNLRVNSLARAHQIASEGFDGPNSTITQGTIQVGIGAATTTITIDGTNNTLSGLANSINAANTGVSATVVNDGRSQPYRLVLTSSKTGSANGITLVNNLGADSGGARRPDFASTYVGGAVRDVGFTGTAVPTSNLGAGGYTGSTNNTYKFTVVTGGTVGTDNGIQISYTDSTGINTGTITLDNTDADVFKSVAQGIQVKLAAGTLVAGQKFTIDAFVPTVQQATDASVTLGSGPGALTVTSATNTIDSLINGVTLNLLGTSTSDITLTVGHDTEKAKKAVLDFVESYNEVMKYIDEQVRFLSGKAGVLLGNRSVTALQDQVRSIAVEAVSGVNAAANRLGALGITTNSQGRLEVNATKLDDALAGRVAGVSLDDVRRLFAFAGKSTNPGVQFVTGSTKTKASAVPYEVNVSQAARQGTTTATNVLAATTVIDGTNNTFTFKVDGLTSTTITLAQGSYSQLGLAQAVQAQINANSSLAGRQVAVSLMGGKLTVTSNSYGLASEVTIGTGTALGALGFTGTETGRGQDVVGHFLVNGQVEAAVGTGQFLVGSSTNANTADLQVRVTLTDSQIVSGSEASLTVTRGVASKLDTVLSGMLDPVNGRLKAIGGTFQTNIDNLKKVIDKQNQVFEAKRQALVRQFVALESVVSKLKSTGDLLAGQLRGLPVR